MNAGMRSADFSLFRRVEGESSPVLDKKAICASLIFLQQWYWQPLLYFISNCIEQKNPVDGLLYGCADIGSVFICTEFRKPRYWSSVYDDDW
jgi:hypothetical protein